MESEGRDEREQQLRDETFRIFAVSQWVGPVGVVALTVVTLYVLWGEIDDPLVIAWAVCAFIGAMLQALSYLVPALRDRRGSSGLPRAAMAAHLTTGLVFGSLLWLDPVMVEDERLRYGALMISFALAAGSVSGLSGLHDMSLRVMVPLFLMSSTALLVRGEWFIAVALLSFLAIAVVDGQRTGALWRELVGLRVDESRRAVEQRWLAEHDELTGVLNRAGLASWLERHDQRRLTAMYVDLDHFKEVNDRLGHQAGDAVLVEVASRLGELVRDADAVVRLGGDEFLVVLSPAMAEEQAAALGRSMIAELRESVVTEAGVAHVSASLGISTSRSDDQHADSLIAAADRALLEAKRLGRDQVKLADDAPFDGPS